MLLQLPEVAQQIETDGIREELAEHYETAGQSAADRISCHSYLSILKILMQGIVMWAHADLTAKITYNDTVALGPHQPIDHSYKAEISDGKIVKEVFEGWFRMSEEKAPDRIPDEYYNF